MYIFLNFTKNNAMKKIKLIYILGIFPIAIILCIAGTNLDIGWLIKTSYVLFGTLILAFAIFTVFGFISFFKKP